MFEEELSDDKLNGTVSEKLHRILTQLATTISNYCRIVKLELPNCQMRGGNTERLGAVLEQCPSLTHLILIYNEMRTSGALRIQAS